MNSWRAAAYHEAGHCYVAWQTQGVYVDWVSIYEGKKGWGGATQIGPTPDNRVIWTTISVAGFVAEAKAEAIREYGAGTQIHITPDVVQAVTDYVANSYQMFKKRKIRAIQIDVSVPHLGQQVESTISRSDVRRTGSSYRDYQWIDSCLNIVCNMCNADAHWGRMTDLAEALLDNRRHRLTRPQINAILA